MRQQKLLRVLNFEHATKVACGAEITVAELLMESLYELN